MLNLDTHILIHALIGDLTPRERKLLASEPGTDLLEAGRDGPRLTRLPGDPPQDFVWPLDFPERPSR